MGISHSARQEFLGRFCPDPDLIEAAISRVGAWTVHDFSPGQFVCRTGQRAEACWLILAGMVEIVGNDQHVAFRHAGDMIGEQAFLTTLLGKTYGRRTADIVARGGLRVACFDASLQERFTPEEQAAWGLTLAAVVNAKLGEATLHRADLRKSITERDRLLERFAEGDALGIVRKAIDEDRTSVVEREVIIWFSDIASFSSWAAGKRPDEVARIIRTLTGRQIECIRNAGGQIDKLTGDGVMAIWFVDTAERRSRFPALAVASATKAASAVDTFLRQEHLEDQLSVRIGLHSGAACFGDFGASERIAVTVLGSDVNLASRYEQAKDASLGPVRVSPQLKALIESGDSGGDWTFQGPATVEVKHGVQIEVFLPTQKVSP